MYVQKESNQTERNVLSVQEGNTGCLELDADAKRESLILDQAVKLSIKTNVKQWQILNGKETNVCARMDLQK